MFAGAAEGNLGSFRQAYALAQRPAMFMRWVKSSSGERRKSMWQLQPGLLSARASIRTVQSCDKLIQMDLVCEFESCFAETMVRIRILPVMPATKRNSGKVGGFLPHPPGAQDACVGGFDHGRPAAHSRTYGTLKRPNPSQILRASVRTPPRPKSFSANWHSPFRRQAALQRRTRA